MTKPISAFTRRKFLTTSLGSLASAGLAASTNDFSSFDSQPFGPDKIGNTPLTRKLGRTGLEVPIVSVGSGSITDPGFIQSCYEIGMRLFDTDARYRNGRHEELLGRVFSRLGVRDRVIIVTKVHPPEKRAGISGEESKRRIYQSLDGCLRRLKSDYVDILLIHDVSSPDPILYPPIMEAMTKVKKQGKTRFIGIATHSNMAVAINSAIEAEIYDVILTSINFTMANDTPLLTAIKNAADKDIGLIAMKTQAGGYNFPNPATLRNFSSPVINSAALKWVCKNENIATSIPGVVNYEHLHANLKVALDPRYTDEEKIFLSDNRIKLGMEFCRQCCFCATTCPREVDIPTLMRTHMYVKQYGDFELARQALDSIPSGHGLAACASCPSCRAGCANSVNIPRKIEELKLIYA